MEDFGKDKLAWLRQQAPLANGIPSHDCIAQVLRRISPQPFREGFIEWTNSVREPTKGKVIAIEGKTARGSRDNNHGRNPLPRVNAQTCRNRLVLAPEATAEKSNEITAIPRLLEILERKGNLMTIDAMGCQPAIASQLLEQPDDQILGLTGNPEQLQEAVDDFFTVAPKHPFKAVEYDYFEETDKDQGRLEVRRYWITEPLKTLPDTHRWKGWRTIGMAEREGWPGDKPTVEQRYFLNSIAPHAPPLARAVRMGLLKIAYLGAQM